MTEEGYGKVVEKQNKMAQGVRKDDGGDVEYEKTEGARGQKANRLDAPSLA